LSSFAAERAEAVPPAGQVAAPRDLVLVLEARRRAQIENDAGETDVV